MGEIREESVSVNDGNIIIGTNRSFQTGGLWRRPSISFDQISATGSGQIRFQDARFYQNFQANRPCEMI